jgi:hypothetical protein
MWNGGRTNASAKRSGDVVRASGELVPVDEGWGRACCMWNGGRTNASAKQSGEQLASTMA